MKILLDENFPLALVPKLREEGYAVEHVILLGQRAVPDSMLIARLNADDVLFLTHDREFLSLPLSHSPLIVSRVTQTLPNALRVEIWLRAIREYFSRAWSEKLFEVFDDRRLLPFKDLTRRES